MTKKDYEYIADIIAGATLLTNGGKAVQKKGLVYGLAKYFYEENRWFDVTKFEDACFTHKDQKEKVLREF